MAVLRGLIEAVFVGFVSFSVLNAATLIVDLKGGAGYTDIQSAIDAAAEGDTVLVNPGEYVIAEPINFNRLHDPDDPASPAVKNIVVKSEGGAEVTTIKMAETPVDPGRASVVVFSIGEMAGSVLEGFTLTGGQGTPYSTECGPFTCGGGIHCTGSPTVVGCRISGNSGSLGGGVYFENGSSPALVNCTISGNRAQIFYCRGGRAFGKGGGVYCNAGSHPTLTDCTISWNSAWGGGGVYCLDSSPVLTNCTISGNSAEDGEGGGVCSYYNSSPTLTNCTISGNSARWCSGGVCCVSSLPTILTNCILWGNTPESVCGNLSHCLTDQDPLFVAPGHWEDNGTPGDSSDDKWVPGDYHLRPGSPAIDAGTSEGAPTTDIDGYGRPCGSGVDIGAYEFGECPVSGTRFIRADADGNGTIEITDPINVLGYLFLGDTELLCLDAADADDSGVLNITDAIYSLLFQFVGGREPTKPFPECGIDPVMDALDCQSYPVCQ